MSEEKYTKEYLLQRIAFLVEENEKLRLEIYDYRDGYFQLMKKHDDKVIDKTIRVKIEGVVS